MAAIKDGVYYVGVPDPDLVTFDVVMETRYGTTYNSYLINAGKKVLIDTVKEKYKDRLIDNIKKYIDPAELDYIICNHTEPDHSGSLPHLLKVAKKAVVMGSGQALGYLKEMNNTPFESRKVMDGDTLDIGGKTLKFIGAPNLHWPDSIYTYLGEDRLLFTCDSFGAHYCKDKIFDDELDDYSDSYKYYFDVILRPFSKFMLKAIEKIEPLEIDMICPGHGPILRSSWKDKLALARQYSTEFLGKVNNTESYILIAYVSAYGYTGEMAHVIAAGIRSEGYNNIEVADIEHMQLGELEERIVRASGILIGSPTINKNTLLPVYKLFSVVNPLRDKGKLAGTFGSYGWSGEAVELIDSHLRNLRFDVPQAGLAIRFYPDQDQKEELINYGKRFARELKEKESISAAS